MKRISYATAGFTDRDLEAALDGIAAAGFRFTEILGQEPHLAAPPTGQSLAAFSRRLQARALQVSSVHAPLGRSVLGAPDEGWRRENVQRFGDYLRFAAAVGADGLIVHPVPNPRFVADADDPGVAARIGDAVHRSLDDLVPVAEETGVRLLLENLPYMCAYPYLTMGTLRPLVDGYAAGPLGLVIDTGHAWVVGNDPAAEIRLAGARLWGTHLQDVARDQPEDSHWIPTHGGLDWDSIRQALEEVGYAGAWTLEVISGRHGESPELLAAQTLAVVRRWGLPA